MYFFSLNGSLGERAENTVELSAARQVAQKAASISDMAAEKAAIYGQQSSECYKFLRNLHKMVILIIHQTP